MMIILYNRPLAKVTFARGGKGKRLKGKGFLLALSPLPLTLFPTSARSLMLMFCCLTEVYCFGRSTLRIKDAISRIKGAISRIKGATLRIKDAISRIKGPTLRIKDAISRIKGAMLRIKDAISRSKGAMLRIKDAISRIKGATLRFRGSMLESRGSRFKKISFFNEPQRTQRTQSRRILKSFCYSAVNFLQIEMLRVETISFCETGRMRLDN
ncbi:MAG: hypothetical protein RMX97_13245 [Nostoc sp. DedQUE11]|nr:hypothetical protein [Nostoc sp. DedQUE11]